MPSTRPPAAPPAERRVAVRRQPALETVCRLNTGTGANPGLGLVWNLSTSGLSMFLHEPLAKGAVLSGELTTMSRKDALPVKLRVIHVRKLLTGDYFLVAQFEESLGADDLRPFVGML